MRILLRCSAFDGPSHEVVATAADPRFVPEPLDYSRPEVWGCQRAHLGAVRQPSRSGAIRETDHRHVAAPS